MKKKCELIRDFNKEYNKELCVLTKGFKAHGSLYQEKEIEGLITLHPAKLYPHTTNCDCETSTEYKYVEWLHIFAEDIVAFSFAE